MYVPSTWMNLTNATLPQVAQQLNSTSLGSGNVTKRFDLIRRRYVTVENHLAPASNEPFVSLIKRAENSTVSYSTQAILCGDAPDRTPNNTATMKDVFDTVISTAHNVSHMRTCLCLYPERLVP